MFSIGLGHYLTLAAIIFLVISKDPINEKSMQIAESSIILNSLESNIGSGLSLKYEIWELNNQISSFLYTDALDSKKVNDNVNTDSIEPDA